MEREIKVNVLDTHDTPLFVVSGASIEELDANPDLQESIYDMIRELRKHGQTVGVLASAPTPMSIDEAYLKVKPVLFGEKLRWLRKRAKLTQTQAAEKLVEMNAWSKCRQSTWAEWEKRDDAPRGRVLDALAAMFEVRPSFFYDV